MTVRKSGLIVNISSIGGILPAFNPAYGIGKAACDRMAADCSIELKEHNVAMVSLWPGAVSTETFEEVKHGRLALCFNNATKFEI